MILGRLAVGLIIFVAVAAIMICIPDWLGDTSACDLTGLVVLCTLLISLYCAISGTYLLYLAGKV